VNLTSGEKEFQLNLIGHSSPEGSDGDITTDISSITTALNIVKSITINLK